MAKVDIKNAYRIVPIHPDDYYLLGMTWRQHYFVDLALPFGLRSAPYIFNSFADLFQWSLIHNYLVRELLHYLQMTARLPPQKLSDVLALTQQWVNKKSCKRKELESLIGKLSHALLTFFGILNATGKLFIFPVTASWIYNGGWISYPRGMGFTFLIYLSGSLWRILNYPVTRLAKRVLACIIMVLGSIERGYLRSNL